jgi:uncharacterized membrane protein YbhN (UPF0104 family)
MSARSASAAAGILLAVILVVLLFWQFDLSLSDLGHSLASVPTWAFGAVFGLTLINQCIGVIRWQRVTASLFPDAAGPAFLPALTATSWGSFFGQVLPVQLAMTAARWVLVKRSGAVGSTLFEQLMDLVVLSAASAAAVLVLMLGAPAYVGVLTLLVLIGCAVVGLPLALTLVASLITNATRSITPISAKGRKVSAVLTAMAELPRGLIHWLLAWSTARLTVLALRMVIVVAVLIPAMDQGLVALGYPIVGLALGIPITPAGLGVADWTWTGLLVLAGAGAAAAALAALVARCLNFLSLLVIVIVLTTARLITGSEPDHKSLV